MHYDAKMMLKCIMNRKTHATRRTTLTLPADSLTEAQQIADRRKVNLSTVIAEALSAGLKLQTTADRSEDIIENYKRAFAGFSEEELDILDGIILEPQARD
jgi:hypothetical protein